MKLNKGLNMATVIEGKGNEYLCTFSVPESGWLYELAKCMGISKEAVLGAAINNGLCHYVESFLKDDIVDKIKEQMQDEIDEETLRETPTHDTDRHGAGNGGHKSNINKE